jgi:predicted glycosyltransferase
LGESPITPYRILIYAHDTYGLGHIRRCLAIARNLKNCPADILILTGSILAGRFKIPSRIDFVRIPGMIKVTNEEYLPLSLKLEAAEVLEIRKKIILATATAFRPDFFIVDKAPLGLKREAVDTLHWLRTDCPTCKSILGLRDIMDGAASTIEEWREKGIYDAMRDLYDEIWVYGCKDFYDPITEYRIPDHIAPKIHFTGYLPRQIPTPEKVAATRAQLGLGNGQKLIVVTTGGGGDGHPVVRSFLAAFDPAMGPVPENVKVVVVTGPFISAKHYQDVVKRCNQLGFTTYKFHRAMERLIGAAQVVVSMGGYNTVCEIVSQKKPLLIVPRTVPREEQLIRAQVLCSRGFCDYLDPRELTPAALRERVLSLLYNNAESREMLEDFPLTGLDCIRERITASKTGAAR